MSGSHSRGRARIGRRAAVVAAALALVGAVASTSAARTGPAEVGAAGATGGDEVDLILRDVERPSVDGTMTREQVEWDLRFSDAYALIDESYGGETSFARVDDGGLGAEVAFAGSVPSEARAAFAGVDNVRLTADTGISQNGWNQIADEFYDHVEYRVGALPADLGLSLDDENKLARVEIPAASAAAGESANLPTDSAGDSAGRAALESAVSEAAAAIELPRGDELSIADRPDATTGSEALNRA